MPTAPIAAIDIDPFIKGGAADRLDVARAFGDAFESTGFAIIVSHGIDADLIEDSYTALLEFFALPFATKNRYNPPEQAKGRGYLPMGIESVAKTLSGETPPDLCEALVFAHIHRELAGAASARPNIWPEEPASLKPLIARYSAAMVELNARLTRMSALALDLPEDYLDPHFADPALVLRFVNYPDQPQEPKPGQLRYGEHHDYGGLTILRQDTAPGGLQLWYEGEWADVPCLEGSFVINVGDLTARWTNGRWRSTLHRVMNPPRHLTGSTQRLSMVAFTGPNEATEIACLPSCASPDNPPRYEPVNSGDYIMAKIRESMELSSANSNA